MENVIFNKDKEYGVTGLKINSILSDKELIKIENVNEQNRISLEIQDLTKNYKEPDLTLFMSHPETKTIQIPFVKKNESDLPKLKLTYFNTKTKKMKIFYCMIIWDILKNLDLNGIVMLWVLNLK